MRLNSFRAIRPDPRYAAQVASVPYDVVDTEEARTLASDNPLSFLHVVRAEIDLPADTDPYDSQVYAKARANLDQLRRDGVLVQDGEPSLFAYRLEWRGHQQTGIVGCVHVEDYENDVIRKHEKTRPVKENDRTRHILELGADAEPVLLTYRHSRILDRLVEEATQRDPLSDFVADDGVRHAVWRMPDARAVITAFEDVPHCYVADGHHRCASAWRAGSELRAENARHDGSEAYNWFPAALFPARQLQILPYNRLLKRAPADLLQRLAELGALAPTETPAPLEPGSFTFFLGDGWHRLVLPPQSIDRRDPIGSLDAQLLQDRVLQPLFGIDDPRTHPDIDFVGGIRGTDELERRVRAGIAEVAIALYPTTVEQLMAVADAGSVMPPKSTWFEPKLRSGLFVHRIDGTE